MNHIDSDPGLHLTPRGRRVRVALIILGLLALLALALTDDAGAAPAKLCTAWRKGCTASRTFLGLRYCVAWRLTCISNTPASGKSAGLAAPLAGNRGGCGRHNMTTATCNVSDAGNGFVSGDCEYGYWFSRVATARTFRVGQIVIAYGCEGLNQELYAPIRISK
jgi:hypothetical protein